MFKAQVAQLRHLVAEMEYLMVLMVFEILKFFLSGASPLHHPARAWVSAWVSALVMKF